VHGIGDGGAARDFREHIAWLQKSFHVVAVDLPGFGQSDKANVLYSPGNYARILKHVAGRFLRSPFALVGHSMARWCRCATRRRIRRTCSGSS